LTSVFRVSDPPPKDPTLLSQPKIGMEVAIAILFLALLVAVAIAVARRSRARHGVNIDDAEETEVIEVVELDDQGEEVATPHVEDPLLMPPPVAHPTPELLQSRREQRRRRKEGTELVVAEGATAPMPGTAVAHLQKRCPACGTIFEVLKGEGPVTVSCPSCGATGTIH